MTTVRPTQGRGPRLLAALGGGLVVPALACSMASAQLPELPQLDPPPLPQTPVQEVLEEPLPPPVEQVVEETPLGPVRDEVRRLVGAEPDTDPGTDPGTGPGAEPSPEATPASNEGQTEPPASAPAGDSTAPAATGREERRQGRRRPARARSRSRAEGGRPADAAPAQALTSPPPAPPERAPARRRAAAESADAGGDGPLPQTVRELVEVIPPFVWLALGALAALATALGLRVRRDRRRAGALERERAELQDDVGVLERALLPPVPKRLGALAASVAYRPAEGLAAGGDFYDAFELSGGRAAVIVGDVSGHGREALQRTWSMRSSLHACLEAGMSPRAALESVAERAASDENALFATVVLAVHDAHTGALTYAAAGHPPPIVTGPGAHEPVTLASAPPVGIGIRTGSRQTTVPLGPGSTVCLFTDGVLEARRGGDLFGRERLSELLRELDPDARARVLLERVIAEADETPDDMAICLLRFAGETPARGPRIEELELDADELALDVTERFLEACDVPVAQHAAAIADARLVAAEAGAAVLEVSIDRRGGRVRASAPARERRPAACSATT